jgi:dihydrofolate reductase
MGKVVVFNHVSLDGVMQAPARPDEDTRGGFDGGGWAFGRMDEVMGSVMNRDMGKPGALLLGRRTYEDFYAVWPKRIGDPISQRLENVTKYVASRTLTEPLPWANSVLLKGEAVEAVARLKHQVDGNLTILGSGDLIQSLMAADLIDEYLLMIHPQVLGRGRRLFPERVRASLRLADSLVTTTGVVINTYERDRISATNRRAA